MYVLYLIILYLINRLVSANNYQLDSSNERIIYQEINKKFSNDIDKNFDFLSHFNKKYENLIDKKKTNGYKILNYILKPDSKRYTEPCANPDQEYLEKLFSDYSIYFHKNENILVKSETSNEALMNYPVIEDESQCNVNDRNTTTVNKRSLCPWKFKININFDRFPAFRTEAKCSCSTCNYIGNHILPKNVYGCLPIFKPMPVLVKKEECGLDGFFKWLPEIEYVNMGCTCGFIQNFISHGKR